jgi:hypothetical protein
LLSSKDGMYCGAVSEMSQPLLPIGMKTPMSMQAPQAVREPPSGPQSRNLGKRRGMLADGRDAQPDHAAAG